MIIAWAAGCVVFLLAWLMAQDSDAHKSRVFTAQQVAPNPHGETPEQVDLHWLRSWSERLSAWIRRPNFEAGRIDWRVFRPDKLAGDALVRFGLKFPEVVGQVREFLDHAERSHENVCQLLPPDGCLSCDSVQDFENEDDVHHCWICGERNKLPSVDHEAIDIAQEGAWNAYNDLAHIVSVAADAIESNAGAAGSDAVKVLTEQVGELISEMSKSKKTQGKTVVEMLEPDRRTRPSRKSRFATKPALSRRNSNGKSTPGPASTSRTFATRMLGISNWLPARRSASWAATETSETPTESISEPDRRTPSSNSRTG